jgi:DNA-binding CsgD family transcriptional regulator
MCNLSALNKPDLAAKSRFRLSLEKSPLTEERVKTHAVYTSGESHPAGHFLKPSTGLSRKPPNQPLNVIVAPFLASDQFFVSRPSAILFISDPNFRPLSRAAVLRTLYGLSPSECRIAELLVNGHTISDIAERLGRTTEGTRFQLKNIFGKTGARRQTELMRLVLSLPAL